MEKKLIIWDFDGVIADTEKIWLYHRMITLNKDYGLNFNEETIRQKFWGMSDQTKKELLKNMGIETDDAFWRKNNQLDEDFIRQKGFELTEGIADIFKLSHIKQCIATGTIRGKIFIKIKVAGIEKYFSDQNVFTADMVACGKPEPDLFLLACEKMGEDPKNTIVVEDSIAGLKAAIRAGCLPVAFTKYTPRGDSHYFKELERLKILNVFDDMFQLKKFIEA